MPVSLWFLSTHRSHGQCQQLWELFPDIPSGSPGDQEDACLHPSLHVCKQEPWFLWEPSLARQS